MKLVVVGLLVFFVTGNAVWIVSKPGLVHFEVSWQFDCFGGKCSMKFFSMSWISSSAISRLVAATDLGWCLHVLFDVVVVRQGILTLEFWTGFLGNGQSAVFRTRCLCCVVAAKLVSFWWKDGQNAMARLFWYFGQGLDRKMQSKVRAWFFQFEWSSWFVMCWLLLLLHDRKWGFDFLKLGQCSSV